MSYLPAILLFVLMMIKIPISFSMIIASLIYFVFFNTGVSADMIIQRMIAGNESFTLLAVPFFVTMGVIMNYSGISTRLMKFAEVLTGHMVGGLGHVNVVLSTLMGGVSGSATADASMECKILVPEMVARGYSPAFSAVVTAASSTIAPIIPPGVSMIIYAVLATVSVGKMFMAGYLPGLLMCIALMIAVYRTSKKRGYLPSREKRATMREIGHAALDSIWALVLPIVLIGGLRIGVFTPTEGGALCILFCLLIGFFVYRELKIKDIPKILMESMLTTSSIMLLLTSAKLIGYYLTWERIPQKITESLVAISNNNVIIFLLLTNILLLFLGMFIESIAMMIIIVPLLLPTALMLGIDPVHFGMIIIVNGVIGGITPPFGSVMYLTCALTKVSILDFVKESGPFIVALVAVLILITYFPQVVMFIPNLVMG